MIRHSFAVSSPFFFQGCESQEWSVKRLFLKEKIGFEILYFWLSANLRTCSKEGEQNALCHGIRGPQTETAAIRPARVGPSQKTSDAMGTFALTNSSSSDCHIAA
jgi:hypothetical protein